VSHESYVIINILCAPIILILLVTSGALQVPRNLMIILSLITLVIFISFGANLTTIMGAVAKGRSGVEKVVTSALVLLFGMYVALLISHAAKWNFRKFFLIPLLFGALVVILFGALEFASYHIGALRAPFIRLYLLTHAGFDKLEAQAGTMSMVNDTGSTGRLTSVLFEAADFGTYLIYVTPWLMALCLSPLASRQSFVPQPWRSCFYVLLVLTACFLALFSGRTAALGVPAIAVLFIVLCLVTRLGFDPKVFGVTSWCIVIGAMLVYLIPIWFIGTFTNEVATAALDTRSNSNISRLGTTVILLNLFKDNPIFGVGMGQYGFYVNQYVPSWAYTFEFRRWIGDPNSSFFPTFSVFARLAGEMGLLGLMTWVGFLAYLLRNVTKSARASFVANRQFPYYGVALITNFFSLGLTGLGMASYRVFWIWALLGLASAYSDTPFSLEPQRAAK
jgi:O-antigen ligase